MNKKQLEYLIARFSKRNGKFYSCLSGVASYYLIENIFNYQGIENLNSILIYGASIALLNFRSSMSGSFSFPLFPLSLFADLKIKINKSKYPIDHSKKVIIDDSNGLEMLLDRTARKEDLEWGTLSNAYDDKGRAVIYKISDPEILKNFKLPGKRLAEKGFLGGQRLNINRGEISKQGYNGFHHYHPYGEFDNFVINDYDRFSPPNWINLLTFNLPEGPEIIGYNRQFVYIPKDKTKKELLLANPKKIIEYLS